MAGRKVDTYTVEIDRSPEVVFDYLSDVSRHGEWSPKPFRVEGSVGPVKAGDSFSTVGVIPGDKQHRNDVTVTECTPSTRLVLDSMERGEHFISSFELSPEGGGTRLVRRMDAPKPSFPLSVVFPLILALVIRPDVERGLENLKKRLESA
jgi:uncharacterized protein YndB with AHSA1/START domain